MQRDIGILKQMGFSSESLKELFTAKQFNDKTDSPEEKEKITELYKKRKKWEDRIDARIQEGVTWSIKNSCFYQAVDLAWDSTPIRKETIPLMLYAQGKVKFENCAKQFEKMGCTEFLGKNDKDEVVKINLPRLYEV